MRFYDTTKQGHAQVLAKHDCAKATFSPKTNAQKEVSYTHNV